MRRYAISILLSTHLFASLNNISSFKADFTQNITDEKNKTISYSGIVIASKPQNAKWSYAKPVRKDVYMDNYEATVVEPEIEQVIIRKLDTNFDFFKMISNTKKIGENVYEAHYKNKTFTITLKNGLIETISYLDEFENRVKIIFKNQKQNEPIDSKLFIPKYPLNYDVIRD